MLGEFFGITAAMSLLLDMNPRRITSLSQIMNNGLDVHRLTKFKKELDYLDFYLKSLKYEYASADLKKSLRNVEFVRKGDVEKAKKLAGVDIEGKSPKELEEMATQMESAVESLAKSMGVDKTISATSARNYKTKERIFLGDIELLILKEYKERLQDNIPIYKASAVETSYDEAMAFGRKVKEIFSRQPIHLTYLVQRMFLTPGVDKKALASKCIQWVKTLESYFGEQTVVESKGADASVKSFNEFFNFESYLLNLEGKSIVTNNRLDLSEERQELLEKFKPVGKEFSSRMMSTIYSSQITDSEMKSLIVLFFSLFMLDHDLKFLNESLFSSGEFYSREELKAAFDNLNSAGFYYLHMDSTSMFLDCLEKLSFTKEMKMTIDPHVKSTPNGYSFAIVANDIENFCRSVSEGVVS